MLPSCRGAPPATSMLRSLRLLALWSAACALPRSPPGGSFAGTSDSTTGSSGSPSSSSTAFTSTSSTTLATSNTVSTSITDTSSSSTGEAPVDFLGAPCLPYLQDCPPGQKCAPYAESGFPLWDSARCVPVVRDPVPVGSPCVLLDELGTGLDNCEIGHICWTDDVDSGAMICAPLCLGPSLAEIGCPDGFYCLYISQDVTVCEFPTCDPLQQDCPDPEQACVPNGYIFDDWCLPEGVGTLDQACDEANVCKKGFACIPVALASPMCAKETWGCCQPFCEIGVDLCPGAGQECLPLWPSDFGVCQLPI